MVDTSILIPAVIYFIVLGVITFFSRRRKNDSEFLIASRKLGWKENGMSVFATMISSYNVILIVILSYLYGFYTMLVLVGLMLSLLFLYRTYNNKTRKNAEQNNYTTVVDYFSEKFGQKVNSFINLIMILVLIFFITLQIKVSSILFSGLFSIGLLSAAILIAGVVLIYSFLGGFRAETSTDVFQGILMLFFLFLAITVVFNGSIKSELVVDNLKDTSLLFNGLALIILQFLVLIVQPELWQRVIASKNSNEFRKSVMLASVLLIIFFFSLVIIGFYAKNQYNIENPNNAIFEILQFVAPAWFLPVVIISVLAAFMSTIDSSLFALTSQLAKSNLLGKSSNQLSEHQIKRRTQLFMLLTILILIPVSLYSGDFLTAVFQLISIMMVISVVYLFKISVNISDKEAFIGLVVGSLFYLYAVFSGLITQEIYTSLYTPFFVFLFLFVQRTIIRLSNYQSATKQ